MERQLPSQILGGLSGSEDCDYVAVDVGMTRRLPVSLADVRKDFGFVRVQLKSALRGSAFEVTQNAFELAQTGREQ